MKLEDKIKKDAIIRMFHVNRKYGSVYALKDINIEIKKNEFVFITGPSGAGKSTLLKLCYLEEKLTEGQIIIDGINISRILPKKIPFLRRKIGIIFQDYKLILTKTVFENISLVLEVSGHKISYIKKKVRSILRTVGMEEKINSYPLGLSGGEQQRVAVARAVVGNPEIIFADEPTGSLDKITAKKIMELLKSFHNRGTTVIIATHDNFLINNSYGRVISLKNGKIIKN